MWGVKSFATFCTLALAGRWVKARGPSTWSAVAEAVAEAVPEAVPVDAMVLALARRPLRRKPGEQRCTTS